MKLENCYQKLIYFLKLNINNLIKLLTMFNKNLTSKIVQFLKTVQTELINFRNIWKKSYC